VAGLSAPIDINCREPGSCSDGGELDGDLAGTFGADSRARAAAAAEVRAACRDTGFMYVKNHGVDQSLIDRAFNESRRFFSQPDDEKLKVRARRGSNGYHPVESQALDPTSPADLKESYTSTRQALPGTPDYAENRWPENLPSFEDNIQAYREAVRNLAIHISRLIALSVDMPLNYFDPFFDNQKASLRLLRYPPMPGGPNKNQLGAGAHTDFGWITVLAQDEHGGLEVETASGDWIAVDPIPGTFIVNLGDLVPAWTNGRYHSSLHRVLNKKSGIDRYSIVLFFNPRYETVVETIPSCLAPGEAPKPPFVSGEHRQARALAAMPKQVN
jgi:isopenicillin N synthase-like dioxygenase